ncbi:5'-3' exonuclease [Candidatus Gromoviella agglomerans]|uniref:5'-3' exonuclease n=1 Tax=Candidatus Gromoviella agglomerans TaxID=2806609 RepID=UPI001E338E46|nr:5'-3' exonuclease H3TH domain-containing protein [Candidatus Gromoviella agglomerans]UFX98385.1 DNA polymerase I domain-containing protein [Candidatus Gromoviella agglomerans]
MKIHIIDGYSMAFRAFYSFPSIINKHAFEIGGLIGFISMISNFIKKIQPTHMLIVFDKGKSFRSEIYKDYKSTRKTAPTSVYAQLPFLRKICIDTNIPFDEVPGFEADDVIASYCKRFNENGYQVCIVSPDKDLMQLVNATTFILNPTKWEEFNEKDVFKKFGVTPNQIVDMQALTGDVSDNIPGAKGIGPKIAVKLIEEFGSLENILNSIYLIKNDRIRQIISNDQENILLSRKLAQLITDVEVKLSPKDIEIPYIDAISMNTCGIMLHDIKCDDKLQDHKSHNV